MNINPFGEIEISNLEDYYSGEIDVDGRMIEVDMNFESESVDKELLIRVEKSISKVNDLVEKSLSAVSDDYDKGENSETAVDYLEHHKEELSEEELKEIFGTVNVTKELFMKAVYVRRIGFYPEDKESFVVVDVMLPEAFTDYIMAVKFNNEGQLSEISMES